MKNASKNIIELEHKFWQSMVDEETDTALGLLDEPAIMVSSHGTMQFDHQQYRQMAEQGTMVVKAFEFSDMNVVFPTDDMAVLTYSVKQSLSPRGKSQLIEQHMADSSVWARKNGDWLCVMHTETPMAERGK